jgi:hypothetical protein
MFTLSEVVPWGRSFEEYRRMFALTDAELGLRILGCADGPASFNAEATRLGSHVVSCDPLYGCETDQIRERIAATYDRVLDETRRNQHEFVWDTIASVDELGRLRMEAMQRFLDDYEAGRSEGRYLSAELPSLPFADGAFELALCSHFLFLYADHLTDDFHRAAVADLCRVAAEVRIFPLLELGGSPSRYVDDVVSHCRAVGLEASIERVPYEFRRGADHMMRVRAGLPR